jgi:putative drug exporter of the RND superfamily
VFASVARFDIRFRWLIVAIWIAITIAAVLALPSLSSVTQSSNAQFLSASEPSVRAGALAAPFEGSNPSSTAIIVVTSAPHEMTAADDDAFNRALSAARRVPGVSLVRDEGASRDGQAREALVVSSAAALGGTAATDVVDGVRRAFTLASPPAGVRFYLTGQLASNVDFNSSTKGKNIAAFSVIFILALLLLVYRAALAPLITLIPAGLTVTLAGSLIAEASKAGLTVSVVTQELLIVLILGAGTDYGLFLVFRVREELGRGTPPRQAIEAALARVGESISYSAITVVAALLTLLLASFGIYRDLGPALAIGVGVMLAASLTLTPALLAIAGRAAFWPSRPGAGPQGPGLWGRLAERVVRRPAAMIALGVLLFGGLAAGIAGYATGGLTNTPPAASDSAQGAAVLAAHFPQASAGSDELLLRFTTPAWDNPDPIAAAQHALAADPVFRTVAGPFTPQGPFTAAQLTRLHATLGPAAALPQAPPAGSSITPQVYAAYRSTAQWISPDGRTVQFYAALRAGPAGSPAAVSAVPRARDALTDAARAVRATAWGMAGQDASSYDIQQAGNSSLARVVPVVLALIFVLLALLLRSLVAPWYLVITVGLSYLAALGFAMIVFVHLGTQGGLNFVLPFLMFVFAMALGEDYNILVMSRIREEARKQPGFRDALTHAMGVTGGTITSAGIILGGTFVVLGAVGGNSQAQELGFSIAFGVLLDTFFVRTLLVPSIAVLLGRRNWWPSRLSRPPAPVRPSTADSAPPPRRPAAHHPQPGGGPTPHGQLPASTPAQDRPQAQPRPPAP